MKTCSKCGYASPDDSSFCMKCGAYFESEPAAPTTGTTSMPGAPVQGAVDAEASMEQGFAKIQAGDFAGAVAAWTQAVKAGLAPSAEVYGRMLDGCVDEIVRSSADTSTHSRAGIADLAILIDDYDLITDLMAGLRDRSQQLGTQRELMNTMNEYMFLAIESFSVYTDLNDLSAICAEAVRVFTAASERVESLEPAQSKHDPKAQVHIQVLGRNHGGVQHERPANCHRVARLQGRRQGSRHAAGLLRGDVPRARHEVGTAVLRAQKKSDSLHFLTLSLLKTESMLISRISTLSLV